MRKNVTDRNAAASIELAADDRWLDIESLARVEVSSEESGRPVEDALVGTGGPGWRAAAPGAQAIRLIFDQPQRVRRIALVFDDEAGARTQEFVLRWSPDGRSFRDIVRQQWNFSPGGASREIEDYRVDLAGVAAVELEIVPDVSGGAARASLAHWRLA
jgi:hypothetical protein